MALQRSRGMKLSVALALLLSVGLLLGLSTGIHSHDGGFSPHCEVCRLTSGATPTLAVVFVLVLILPEATAVLSLAPLYRAQTSRRRPRSRGPPLD